MITQPIKQADNPRKIKNIVIHCTATPQNTTIQSIRRYWKENLKWKSPGYHYIVEADGLVATLQTETLPTNGVAGHNANSIHISYIGGVTPSNAPIDNRTKNQKESIRSILIELVAKYPEARILGHRDFPSVQKACPCFDAIEEYKDL